MKSTAAGSAYQHKKAELVSHKVALKSEKESLQKQRMPIWIEPTKEFVKTLEMAGKIRSIDNLSEVTGFVEKVGTNRLVADKHVCLDFQKPFDFTASFLASLNSSRSDSTVENTRSPVWCPRQDLNLYDVTH